MAAQPIHPAALPPDELLAQCEVRFVRRSGPGGQHRNKVSTGVVLRHKPTGIEAEAAERRSQAENRAVALFRLRVQLALDVRAVLPSPFGRGAGGEDGKVECGVGSVERKADDSTEYKVRSTEYAFPKQQDGAPKQQETPHSVLRTPYSSPLLIPPSSNPSSPHRVGAAAKHDPPSPSPLWQSRAAGGRIAVSAAHDDFPALLAEALDVLACCEFEPKPAGERLRCTPSQLVKFLQKEPRAMLQVNRCRQKLGKHPLR